jgi:hypothetical protein
MATSDRLDGIDTRVMYPCSDPLGGRKVPLPDLDWYSFRYYYKRRERRRIRIALGNECA